MVSQASQFTDPADKAKYLDAAARFRLPYWDPIMPRNKVAAGKDVTTMWGLPQLFNATTVFLKTPSSPKKFVPKDNPMYSFAFPQEDDWKAPRTTLRKKLVMPGQYNQKQTTRTPNKDGTTDNQYLDLGIQRNANNLASKIWQMLNPDEVDRNGAQILVNQERPWTTFANDQVSFFESGEKMIATVSLESWHNSIHGLIGTGQLGRMKGPQGQMGNPAFAGFEPMFYMHHCNIDRLLSLYQALFGKNVGSAQASDELLPFVKSVDNGKRKCYNSTDPLVKDYWTAGFATPGVQQLATAAVRQKAKEYLTTTYYWASQKTVVEGALSGWPKNLTGSEALHGDSATPVPTSRVTISAIAGHGSLQPTLVKRQILLHTDAPPGPQDTPIAVDQVMQVAKSVNDALPHNVITATAAEGVIHAWDAHIRVRKYAFDGSFNVHIFIGWVKNEQPERYMTKKNEVSFTTVFAAPSETSGDCATCEKNRRNDISVEDAIPLTTQLSDYLDSNPISAGLIAQGNLLTIPSLAPEHVVPFLKEHLQWRMTDLGAGLLVGQEQQALLEVAVSSRTFTLPTSEQPMGVYGPRTLYPEITSDKAGGYGHVY